MKLTRRYSYEPGSRLPYPPDPWTCPHGFHIDRCPDPECVALREEDE